MKRFKPETILPLRPFLTGMAASLDIFGVSGLRMYERIQDHWLAVVSQPWPSAEESIQDSVAAVNGEYRKLLSEHLE